MDRRTFEVGLSDSEVCELKTKGKKILFILKCSTPPETAKAYCN